MDVINPVATADERRARKAVAAAASKARAEEAPAAPVFVSFRARGTSPIGRKIEWARWKRRRSPGSVTSPSPTRQWPMAPLHTITRPVSPGAIGKLRNQEPMRGKHTGVQGRTGNSSVT
jgi:hypothetical protein